MKRDVSRRDAHSSYNKCQSVVDVQKCFALSQPLYYRFFFPSFSLRLPPPSPNHTKRPGPLLPVLPSPLVCMSDIEEFFKISTFIFEIDRHLDGCTDGKGDSVK